MNRFTLIFLVIVDINKKGRFSITAENTIKTLKTLGLPESNGPTINLPEVNEQIFKKFRLL